MKTKPSPTITIPRTLADQLLKDIALTMLELTGKQFWERECTLASAYRLAEACGYDTPDAYINDTIAMQRPKFEQLMRENPGQWRTIGACAAEFVRVSLPVKPGKKAKRGKV